MTTISAARTISGTPQTTAAVGADAVTATAGDRNGGSVSDTVEGLRLAFGDLPPGVLQGPPGPYETIGFATEVLPALTAWPGAAAHTAAEGGARRHNPNRTLGGLFGPESAARHIQCGRQLTFRSRVTALTTSFAASRTA